MEIQDILRAQEVHRWNITATIRNQSLAEHTFNVTMIARAICKEMGHSDSEVIKAALEHDLDEIITGDIPTPTKMRMKALGFNPDSIHNGRPARGGITNVIIKVSDLMEGTWFIENNAVTRHTKEVAAKMGERTRGYITSLLNEEKMELQWKVSIGVAAKEVWRKMTEGKLTI